MASIVFVVEAFASVVLIDIRDVSLKPAAKVATNRSGSDL